MADQIDINDLSALCAATRGALPGMPTDQLGATAAALCRVEALLIAQAKAQREAAAAPAVTAEPIPAETAKG